MESSLSTARDVFDGSPTSDVKKLFFFYENVAMRGKTDDGKAMDTLSHLKNADFDLYYEMFCGWSLFEGGGNI